MPHGVLTAIGADRPGLVEEVSQFVFHRGGNIEESRMVNLRGQFAIMMLVGGTADVLGRVRGEVGELSRQSGLHAELRDASEPQAPASPALPFRLKGTAIDQPGLVHRVAHLLRGSGVNIENLETHLTPAPYTGAPMFEMELVLAIPQTTPVGALRQRVASLFDELNVDWTLEPV